MQNLVEAAAASYVSGSPTNSKQSREDTPDRYSENGKDNQGKGEEVEIRIQNFFTRKLSGDQGRIISKS